MTVPADLAFRSATPTDVRFVVELVQSAYRGDSSRAGWTTEADLIDGVRTDAATVDALIADPRSLVLLLTRRHPDARANPTTARANHTPAESMGIAASETIAPSETADTASTMTDAEGAPGDEILACCHLRDDGGRAYFGLFAVRPGSQGGGIGRAVMAEAQRLVVARWGAKEMWMTVISQRHDLIAWYERLGFALTGETQPFPYGDERFGLPKRADLEFAVLAKPLA